MIPENEPEEQTEAAEEAPPERAEPKVDPETVAAARLRLAKQLLDRGVKSGAKKRLEEIVDEFPGTPAAEEAKTLLEGL